MSHKDKMHKTWLILDEQQSKVTVDNQHKTGTWLQENYDGTMLAAFTLSHLKIDAKIK